MKDERGHCNSKIVWDYKKVAEAYDDLVAFTKKHDNEVKFKYL